MFLFDPDNDITNVWKRLKNDSALLTLLGLTTEKSDLEIAKHIIKRSQWDDLAGTEKRVCVYFRPSRRAGLDIVTEEVLQIDCHVPAKQDYVAYQVQKQIRSLLHNYEVSGRIFYFDGQLGELPSMPGFFCAGSRYRFYSLI